MAHEHKHYNEESDKNLIFAFIINFSFAIFEIIGGMAAGSFAIVSDALHDLGDSLILLVTVFLNRSATNTISINYPFGKQRLRLVGTIITYLILLIGSVYVLNAAITKLSNPTTVNTQLMLIMAIIGVLANSVVLFRMRLSKTKLDRAIMLHFLEDVLGWIAVLVSAVVIHITELYVIDPLLSIMISLYIIYNCSKNLYSCIKVIMLQNPSFINEVIVIIKKYDNNILDYEVKIIEIDDDNYILCLEANITNIDKLKEELKLYNISEIYIK